MPNDFFEPRLEHLFDIHVDLDPPQSIGATPVGVRQIVPLKGGRITGPKLNGEILTGGGDWATVRSDRAIQVDVRATIKTDDGAMIYSYYGGLIIAEPAVFGRLLASEDVPLGDYYHYINPMFQTGAEQYNWLNQVVAIGRGRVIGSAVEYRVWALRNP